MAAARPASLHAVGIQGQAVVPGVDSPAGSCAGVRPQAVSGTDRLVSQFMQTQTARRLVR